MPASANSSTQLASSDLGRERLIDMETRLVGARRTAYLSMAAAQLAAAPWIGWWFLVPLGVGLICWTSKGPETLERAKRPELVAIAFFVIGQLLIGSAVVVTGGPESLLLPWMMISAATLPSRFTGRGVAAGAIATVVTSAAAALSQGLAAFAAHPAPLIISLGLLGAVTAYSMAIMRAEVEHRVDAVLDPLTGTLNRKALTSRFEEVRQQAAMTGAVVSVIAYDLDRFKSINDTFGHGQGDHVLKDSAYTVRKSLRSFELLYRVGGEEFLVLLPGVELRDAAAVAERMRASVEASRPGGIDVTASFGVASAIRPEEFESLFERADAELYTAKGSGRNRVSVAGAPSALPAIRAAA